MNKQEAIKIDSVRETRPVKADKQEKKVGTIFLKEGHKVYEYNTKLFQLTLAKHESVINLNKIKTKKIIINQFCYYFTALNENNAKRKIQAKFNPEFIVVLD